METKTTINNLDELADLAKNFLTHLIHSTHSGAVVVALSGDLGAGKTTLVQFLAKELGVTETVTSPTFTIMKIYSINDNQFFKNLVHIDAYRLEEMNEVRPLGLSEILQNPDNLVCIEWAERILPILPTQTVYVSIDSLDLEKRLVTITHSHKNV